MMFSFPTYRFPASAARAVILGVGMLAAAAASAQAPGSALDYMLQRPAVAKHFKDKTFADHAFVEVGAGANFVPYNTASPKLGTPGLNVGVAFGDWVTPVHGWRFGVQTGQYKFRGIHSNYYGLAADYLLNFNAVASPTRRDSIYPASRAFEVIGVAGVEGNMSRADRKNEFALGAHLGLQARISLSPGTYLYVEPRVSLMQDDLFHINSWRGYRLGAQMLAGLGFRFNTEDQLAAMPYETDGHFLDDAFITFSAGPSMLLTDEGSESDHLGARAQVYIGKWFSGTSAVRLGVGAASYHQEGHSSVRALSATAGYLWNVTNAVLGYNPQRKFTLSALADVGVTASSSRAGRSYSPIAGVGVQGNYRIAHGVDFFLEPRVDFANDRYATFTRTTSKADVAASLMAGFTFRQGLDTRSQLARNADFQTAPTFDHFFVQAAAGGDIPVTTHNVTHPTENVRPRGYVGVGKWFTPTSGARIFAAAAQYQTSKTQPRVKTMSFGLDYLWNINNAFHGYRPDRRFELVGSVGLNLATRTNSSTAYLGANAGLQGLWHANSMLGFYIEPQARFYNDHFLSRTTSSFFDIDILGALMAGVQINLDGYNASRYEAFASADQKAFFSVGAGTYLQANRVKHGKEYGLAGRFSYGRWYSPVAAWRLSLEGHTNPRRSYRYSGIQAGFDYLVDATAYAFGYDEDRVVNVRPLAGVNIGAEYRSAKGTGQFVLDGHVGAQLGVRLSKRTEAFVEPQLGYRFDNYTSGRYQRVTTTALVGLNFRMNTEEHDVIQDAPEKNSFVSGAIGAGIHSSTITTMHPKERKLTADYDLAFGHWLNAARGYRIGISDVTIQNHGGNRNVTSFRADYMMNLLSTRGTSALAERGFRLTGLVGASVNVGSRKGESPRWAPGLQAAIQPGWMLSPSVEIYLEGSGAAMGKRVIRDSSHPVEGELRLMVGTKVCF